MKTGSLYLCYHSKDFLSMLCLYFIYIVNKAHSSKPFVWRPAFVFDIGNGFLPHQSYCCLALILTMGCGYRDEQIADKGIGWEHGLLLLRIMDGC